MAAISGRYAFMKPDLHDVEVALPNVATGPGVGSSFGVLKFGNLEVELNDSSLDLLPEHFTAGSAAPEDEITLSNGLPVVVGRIDGRAGQGHCFGIKVGARCLLGSVPATVPLDTLASWLSDLHITSTDAGLTVTPTKATWSTERTANVVVGVTLRSGRSSLLDIRPAFRGLAPARAGVPVKGGFLSRQGQADRSEHLVLNATDHVVYILTPSAEALDEIAELGSGVIVRSLVN
ncbi:MAG TPA: hypothetical protein VF755_06590 [Catenuloplanes sp.]|jgi:hypothetical protein